MGKYRVNVEYAHGDDFSQRFMSDVEVDAPNETKARLYGEQMAYTPHPGKPDHMQITRTTVHDTSEHICNADPASGKVCSHLVTADQLAGMGHPVKSVEKGPFGTPIVMQAGVSHEQAVMDAWRTGHVQLCSRTESTNPMSAQQFGEEPEWLKRALPGRK